MAMTHERADSLHDIRYYNARCMGLLRCTTSKGHAHRTPTRPFGETFTCVGRGGMHTTLGGRGRHLWPKVPKRGDDNREAGNFPLSCSAG